MNIPNLKYYNNKGKKINLTANNNTPKKFKRFSFSDSQTSKQNKSNCRNRRLLNDCIINNFSYNKTDDNKQKYIFNKYKVSPLIALLIYEKAINNLFEFIRERLPTKIFIEFKKKYILFVTEELHLGNKNIISNLTDKELINLNIKLFVSQNNSNFLNYNKFFDSYQLKLKCNSNSLFKLNKIQIKKGKLSPLNSFNTELTSNNKFLINSSKIFIRPKNKMKNVCKTEYKNEIDKIKLNNKKLSLKEISKFKPVKNKRKNITDYLKKISNVNGSLNNVLLSTKESKKKLETKVKLINKGKNSEKIFRKLPMNKTKHKRKEKNIDSNKKEEKDNVEKKMEIKDNEKYSIKQLSLIKENLEDNLKNMFNFSYGYFLNNERESDSSKSLQELNRFNNNNDFNNYKKN